MLSLRDQFIFAILASAAEAYLMLHFRPDLKPTGGLGRLTERFLLANMGILLIYRWFVYPFLLSPLRNLPKPPNTHWILGNGREQFNNPRGEEFKNWMNTIPNDGLIYVRGFFNLPQVMATNHEVLKGVLSDHSYDYVKPQRFVRVLRRILGDGLILVEGNVHKFQRKHLLPSFQLKHIRDLYPLYWRKASEMVTRIQDECANGEDKSFEFEFGEWCMRVTLDIIGVAGFGRDFKSLENPEDELVQKYSQVLEPTKEKMVWFVLNVVFPPRLINMLPWWINKELKGIQTYLKDFAINMVKERRAYLSKQKEDSTEKAEMNDILSLLVKSNDFTDAELAEQVLTMMAAGHETTSSALSWCAYLLSTHPDIQRRLREEIRDHLPSPDSDQPITAAEVDALPLLNGVCNEVLRLYPTVPITVREAIRDTPLAGMMLPKGTTVLLSPWAINRSKHFWGDDAEEFRPDRWFNADGTVNKNGGSHSNYSQLTFLHGPRSCIGQGFAQSELKCLLAAFVGRYEFELAKKGADYFPAGLVTTKPANGMWLKMTPVAGW